MAKNCSFYWGVNLLKIFWMAKNLIPGATAPIRHFRITPPGLLWGVGGEKTTQNSFSNTPLGQRPGESYPPGWPVGRLAGWQVGRLAGQPAKLKKPARQKLKSKLISISYTNFDISCEDIENFVNNNFENNFFKKLEILDDIKFNTSLHLFTKMNCLFYIFKEISAKNNTTKKIIFNTNHNKTRKNL